MSSHMSFPSPKIANVHFTSLNRKWCVYFPIIWDIKIRKAFISLRGFGWVWIFIFLQRATEFYHTRAVFHNFQDFIFKSYRTQLPCVSDRQQCASSALVDMNKIIHSTTIRSFSKGCKLCLLLWHILYIILHGDRISFWSIIYFCAQVYAQASSLWMVCVFKGSQLHGLVCIFYLSAVFSLFSS